MTLRELAREAEIDQAVAEALNRVNATYAECEAMPKRMERDKGWRLRADEGVWTFLKAKRPKEQN